MDDLLRRVEVLERKIELLEKKKANSINNFESLIKRKFEVDKSIIIQYMNKRSINGDIELLKIMYNNNIPIRIGKNGRTILFSYFMDNEWKQDNNTCTYIINTLFWNLQKLYSSINNMDTYTLELFIVNQDHINNLVNNKNYRKKFLDTLKRIYI